MTLTCTVTPSALPGILLLTPARQVLADGFVVDSFNARAFRRASGVDLAFVQDNHSLSSRGVLRGLHYQVARPQGKLVSVAAGRVFDVAVDLRAWSPTFGRWQGVELSAENGRQLWIPPGFAHGFLALSDGAQLLYKTTDYWFPEHERALLWNDPAIGIAWPWQGTPTLSEKDRAGTLLAQAECYREPWTEAPGASRQAALHMKED